MRPEELLQALLATLRAVDVMFHVMSDYGYVSASRGKAIEKELHAARAALGLTEGGPDAA